MEVEVKLYAALKQYRPKTAAGAPHHPFSLILPADATVATLIAHLGIPADMITAAGRNDAAVEVNAPLQDGDVVRLFPPSAGG